MTYYCKTCKRIFDGNRGEKLEMAEHINECVYCGSLDIVEARYCPICNEVIENDDDSYCVSCIKDFYDYIIDPIDELILEYGNRCEAKEIVLYIVTNGEERPENEDLCPVCGDRVNDRGILCIKCQKELDCIFTVAEQALFCDYDSIKEMACTIYQIVS